MLLNLIIKEFKQIFRNTFIPKLLLLMPIAELGIFPFAANLEINNLQLSVVDNDRSSLSQRLIEQIQASKYFSLNDISASYKQALHQLEQGYSDIILQIPAQFEKNLITNDQTSLMLSVNNVNSTKGVLGNYYLINIIKNFNQEFKQTNPYTIKNISLQSFDIVPHYLFNPKMDYKIFMVPALIVMLLTIICGFLPALNIVSEKEKGTIEQINVTPVKRLTFIFSKLIPYWIIGFFIFIFSMFLAFIFYGLTPKGNIFTLLLFTLIYIAVVSSLGLIVSNYASTLQQAMFVIFFFMLIFILTSGLFTPISSMPQWTQYLTTFNPLKYFIQAMRSIYLKGSNFLQLKELFFSLTAFVVVLSLWAIKSYKKNN